MVGTELRVRALALIWALATTCAVSGVAHGADPADAKAATKPGPGSIPGVVRVILPPVTPEESERAVRSRPVATNLNQAGATSAALTSVATPVGPASVIELARALRNDPDLIYEYVRNNIEYYPIWGIHKGAVGAILDNRGTACAQAALMVALLRASGYTASFMKGRIDVPAADFGTWLGVSTANSCAVLNLLGQGQVPVSAMNPSSGCGPLVTIQMDHVWVKVNIGGTNYYFDPSFKPHSMKAGIDLAGATGYNGATYLGTAKSGSIVTGDYVQGINRTGVRNSLATYANNLASYLRANRPAAGIDDVIGGSTITKHDGTKLRQASIPRQTAGVTPIEWTGDVPAEYKPTLRVQYQDLDRTYTSDAVYGSRLTLTFDASSHAVLSRDGSVEGASVGTTPAGGTGTVTFTVTHGAYASTLVNQTFTQSITAGGTYLIGNAWGPAGGGPVEFHRARLDNAKASGSADSSEIVLGSMLAVLSSTWIAQVNRADAINDALAGTTTLFHHQIGIAGYKDSAYVDLPGNVVSVISQTNDRNQEDAAFFNASMHSSIFESTAVQQTTTVSAVSTVKLIDMAAGSGDRIYGATSANYATAVEPNLVSCGGYLPWFRSAILNGRRLILPTRCNLTENRWTGTGYFDIAVSAEGASIGAIIGGGLAGGFSSTPQIVSDTVSATLTCTAPTSLVTQITGFNYGDPVDMTKGHYLYQRTDIATGVGEFPHGLAFQRQYSSGLRTRAGPLGKGWTHNFAITATANSDGMQGLGEDSGLDAVATIVELMVSLDLMKDATKPLDKMVIATLGQRWFGDQLVNNTVIVQQGLNGEIFVKLPDGTYNAPPGNAAKLIRNADGTYTYETVHRAQLRFDATGKIGSYVDPSGVQVAFSYTGNDLTKVQNSLGRTLTVINTSGRITNVQDGVRSVSYDASSGNLTRFTDANGKATTFAYALPGQLAQIFYPANATNPAVTNAYDSFGRVQTQTNANGKQYTYFFAGSRSEEVAPDGSSNASYVDGLGKVLKKVDPLGRITANTYDAQSRLVRTVFPEGNSVEYTYDDAPCAAQQRCTHNVSGVRRIAKPGSGLPDLRTSATYYDQSFFNLVKSSTDARAGVTDYTYNAQGLVESITRPADSAGVRGTATYSYTAYASAVAGLPNFSLLTNVRTLTRVGNVVDTALTYDPTNRYVPRTSVTDAGTGKLNLTTTFTYDGYGNLTQVDGPRTDVSDMTSYAYDSERRRLQTTDALGKSTRQAYDDNGRLVRVAAQIGAQWLVTCTSYTLSGKPQKQWGPGLTSANTNCPTSAAPTPVVDYAYDDLDRPFRVTQNLTSAEGGSRIAETTYYADGSIRNSRRAVGTTLEQTETAYTYTANGLVATLADAKSNLTTYEYDGHDRTVKVRYPDKVQAGVSSASDYEQYGFDDNGNVTSRRTRSGGTITLAYDALNRVVSRTYPTSAENVSFAYDLVGHPTLAKYADNSFDVSYAWDNAGRMQSAAAGGRTIAYGYDPAGNRIRTTWPESTFFVTSTYDALNRVGIIKELDSAMLATYGYDDLSRRTTVTLGNGTSTSYGYDNQGGLGSLGLNLGGAAQGVSYSYARNQAQEITSLAWTNDTYRWTGYVRGTRDYTANGLNQYSAVSGTAFGYDTNGNLKTDGFWTYTYDLDNRLRVAANNSLTGTLAWDAAGRLRQTTIGGATTQLLYDGQRLVAEYDGAGALLRRYVHGPGVDEPLVKYEGAGTTSKAWLYADHLGSVIATADAAGNATAAYTYGPYGEVGSTPPPRFGYTGQQYLGQLGLYHYKARMYSPGLGRFLQTDPLGTKAVRNRYSYVRADPVNAADPTGLIDIFVGGMSDWLHRSVLDYYAAYHAQQQNSVYFQWTDAAAIRELIKQQPPGEPINLVGHSFGGHTAAQVAASADRRIDLLVTIDPVGRSDPGNVVDNVNVWVNVTAAPNPQDGIAMAGGKGGQLPTDRATSSYSVNMLHGQFGAMMDFIPPEMSSPASILRLQNPAVTSSSPDITSSSGK